ncbi:Glycosyltransferase involved in cell wall bisynthesis [Bacteroides luti]|uniref:Glycosyltransferase involved in cell wall bisynthesis n=1 Tax=Bacteroides luti TaxID=1297750 RepID=A0A1M4W8V3_9BACE|nr:glycosyltransferase family A protein [Bacteroides luti]SHE77585.1 Glycosyltransferase involved in cell wall bisynthesis [Bacteroides luti]
MNAEIVPKVSVICLAYNHESFIRKCMDGFVMQQANFSFEVLVHDDASTDNTASIIREYEVKYPDLIKPIYQTENKYSQKIDIPRTYQYPRAKGEYIAICEGDDYWIDPLKLQKQVDFLDENPDYGLVWTDVNCLHQESQKLQEGYFKKDVFDFCNSFNDYLLYAPFRAPCTWVFRKKCICAKHMSYVAGDLPLILDVLACYKVKKMDDVTAVYRVLDKSASHFCNVDKFYAFMKGIYRIKIDYALKYNVSEKLVETINLKYCKDSYLYAAAAGDMEQVITARKMLLGRDDLTKELKLRMLLSRFRTGRLCLKIRVKIFLIKKRLTS